MILVSPKYNELPFLHIHIYSICILSGISVCVILMFLISKIMKLDIKKDVLYDFIPSLLISGIIGARLYYVLLSMKYFSQHPKEIFMLWEGGLSIHGALLFGIVYGVYYFKKRNLSFLKYADIIALVLPIGQAIGRFGNFFNQEAFGHPAYNFAPLKLYVDPIHRPFGYENYSYFHPVFLYESILNVLIFFVLLFIMKKTAGKKRSGFVFFSYIFLYSLIRTIMEPFRLDTVFYIYNIPFPLLISVILIIISAIGIIYLKKTYASIID